MVIDIFVHHLGVVISEATASLEYFDHLVHVDTFVVSLANYQATPYGSTTPNTVQTTAIGQLQGTRFTHNFPFLHLMAEIKLLNT